MVASRPKNDSVRPNRAVVRPTEIAGLEVDRPPPESRQGGRKTIIPPSISGVSEEKPQMRIWLAKALLIIVAVTVAACLLFAAFLDTTSEKYAEHAAYFKEVSTFALGPLLGILATVIGFYFGETK